MSEAERKLVLLAGRGDPEAFTALIERRRPRLLVLLAAAIGDWHEAEDALQEVLWRAYCHVGRLREPATFDLWLRQIAVNEARDRLRSAVARMRREGSPVPEVEDATDPRASAEALVERDGCAGILAAIGALPPRQRRAANLAWVADVAPREVAGVLGVSAASVHSALHRARRRLGDGFTRGEPVPGAVRVGGFHLEVQRLAAHWAKARPDLRVERVEWQSPQADVTLGWQFWEAPLPHAPSPPPAAEALPLDRLAEIGGLDLEPFGRRLLRHAWGERPYRLPHYAAAEMVVYNARLLQQLGLPPPPANWTWDEFFGYCRRAVAAGWVGCAPAARGDMIATLAEQFGATEDNLEPVRPAVAFVRAWAASGLTPVPTSGWGFGPFFRGRALFSMVQASYAHTAFTHPGVRPFPWGVAPMPRLHRSDPHRVLWYHSTFGVRGTAQDPMAAFAIAQAAFTDGPPLRGAELPAYRTREVMRAWRAQPYPLGKESLLELEAMTGPMYAPPNLYCLPGGKAIFDDLFEGGIGVDEAIGHLREAIAARHAGVAPVFTDP